MEAPSPMSEFVVTPLFTDCMDDDWCNAACALMPYGLNAVA